jgi:hypothetical protein
VELQPAKLDRFFVLEFAIISNEIEQAGMDRLLSALIAVRH